LDIRDLSPLCDKEKDLLYTLISNDSDKLFFLDREVEVVFGVLLLQFYIGALSNKLVKSPLIC